MAAPTRPARLRRWREGRRGQSLVEFAVVFPVFILLLAGMVDFGLGLYANVTIINAAREGARLGVTLQPMDPNTIDARVRAMSTGLNTNDPPLTVTTTCVGPCSPAYSSGDTVKVQVDYLYRMIWPLTFGTQIPLSSTVQMRIE